MIQMLAKQWLYKLYAYTSHPLQDLCLNNIACRGTTQFKDHSSKLYLSLDTKLDTQNSITYSLFAYCTINYTKTLDWSQAGTTLRKSYVFFHHASSCLLLEKVKWGYTRRPTLQIAFL